jgi:hypothetical protein
MRTFAKDATNTGGGGGQIQIQRQHHSQPRQQLRVPQQNLHKQEAMHSVGISMEQGKWVTPDGMYLRMASFISGIHTETASIVKAKLLTFALLLFIFVFLAINLFNLVELAKVMEDLRVLEEQQQESQRKLSQIKNLKQNRLERYSAVENQLVSLKYKNGEHRVQLNRAHDVLSSATREMEALKLDATRNDDRLKAINKKLKCAQARSRIHETYRHKIDGRIIAIRGREILCHRLLTARTEGCQVR